MLDVMLSASIGKGHVVVGLCGELDVTCAAAAEAAITALVARGQWLIIDMSALDFVDCGSLGALLRVQGLVRQAGGDLVLAAPGRLVLRLLALTGGDDVFCVNASVAAAVVSVGSRRGGTVGAGLR
jgi:anti-sigma B factor antagonist